MAGAIDRPVRAAVLPQGAGALPPEVPAVAFVRSHAEVSEGEARRLLGHFGLEGDAALRPLGRLSPGERARTAIAAMVAARPSCCCSTSPPTTSTSPRSRCSRPRCATTRARSSPSPTTARSSRRSGPSGASRVARRERWSSAYVSCGPWPTRSPSPAGRRRWTSSTWRACARPRSSRSRTIRPGRPPTGRRSATCRCASGSPSSTASSVDQVLVTNGSMQADAFLFELLVNAGRHGGRRVADLRPHAAQPAQPRRRHPDGRRWRPTASTSTSSSGCCATRACARRSPTSSPTSRTPPATRSARAKRAKLLELAARVRLHALRGRPVHRHPLRGRGAADDALAGRRRPGRLRVVVLQDRLPRHPRRLPRRPGRP